MPSKNSSLTNNSFPMFQKHLFLKNIQRFWPVWTGILLMLFYLFPLYLLSSTSDTTGEERYFNLASDLSGIFSFYSTTLLLLSALCALCVFFYQYHENSFSMYHSFPMKKNTLFLTNYLSGLSFLLVPQLLNAVVLLALTSIVPQMPVKSILFSTLALCVIGLFYYSFAVFCCILSGCATMMPVYYFVLNFFGMFLSLFLEPLIRPLLYGYPGNFDFDLFENFSPVNYISSNIFLSVNYEDEKPLSILYYGNKALVVLFLCAIALFFLSYFLYQIKRVESAGDTIAFPKFQPVFSFVFMLCFSILTTLATFTIIECRSSIAVFLCMLVFGVLSYYISKMILLKTFRVFKEKPIGLGVFAALLLIFYFSCTMDLTGYSKKLPKESDVLSAAVFTDFSNGTICMDDPETIQKIIAFQKIFIEERSSLRSSTSESNLFYNSDAQITFSYVLKNKKTITRSYPYPYFFGDDGKPESSATPTESRIFQATIDLYSSPTVLTSIILPEEKEFLTDVQFQSISNYEVTEEYGETYDSSTLSFSSTADAGKREKIYDGIKQDIADGNITYRDFFSNQFEQKQYLNTLSLAFRVPSGTWIFNPYAKYWDLYDMPEKTQDGFEFQLTENCVHTISALKDIGAIFSTEDLIPERQL